MRNSRFLSAHWVSCSSLSLHDQAPPSFQGLKVTSRKAFLIPSALESQQQLYSLQWLLSQSFIISECVHMFLSGLKAS